MHPLIPELDLSDWMERDTLAPVHDLLQILHDEEHESDDPHRLHTFHDLVHSPERSSELDQDLVPWLLRYLWDKPYPNYTRHAWRALQHIALDPEALEPHAAHVLRHHPHGDLRAEVLVFHEARHPQYLESDPFLEQMRALAVHDPAPRVRVGAWEFLEFAGGVRADDVGVLCDATVLDPAAEVRTVTMALLSGLRLEGLEPTLEERRRTAQETALQDERNAWVLPSLMRSYLRTRGIHSDPDRAAFALDLLASRGEVPRRAEVTSTLSWQIPWGTKPHGELVEQWLAAAPFGSGEGFVEALHQRFRDRGAPPVERIEALHALYAYKRVRLVSLQEAVDAYLEPDLGPAAVVTWADTTPLLRALFAAPVPPVTQANTRVELLACLVARTRRFETREAEQRASDAVRFLAQAAMRIVRNPTVPDAEAQALLDAAVDAVARSPGDASFGLYDLRDVRPSVSLGGVWSQMQGAVATARDSVAEYLAIAYANTRTEDRLGALLTGMGAVSARHGLVRVVRELPLRASLDPAHGDAIAQALQDRLAQDELPEWPRTQVERWLSDG